MALATSLGRQTAHDVVHDAATQVATVGKSFSAVLMGDPRVAGHLDSSELDTILNPAHHVGLSADIAAAAARRARVPTQRHNRPE